MNEMQPSLFEVRPTATWTTARGATIEERCDAYIAANAHVYRTFCRMALDAQRRGMARWSAKGIFEVMRYMGFATMGAESYKLPNDFTSRFSRRAMAEHPCLVGFFETRELKAE
jgi:hypothetical protein